MINVLAELERAGVSYEWAGEDEIKVCCPFHGDTQPSCGINVEKRLFKCHAAGCGADGDFVSYLARLLKTTRALVLQDLSTRYDVDEAKTIDASVVERYHAGIWEAGPLLKALRDRGVTDALIRKYRLGVDDGRVTIPIKNERGLFVNVRKYLPGAPGNTKMRNTRGHGKIRLFPIEQLKYDRIVLCGGEMKAIVAADELNRHGIGAITATCGEGNWEPEFTRALADKRVWVCLDVDEEGQKSARERCAVLSRTCEWVGNLVLPLDRDQYPHGDVNDWVGQEHAALLPLLDACDEWVPPFKAPQDEEPADCDIKTATSADMAGKRIRVPCVVSAMDTAPYVVPRQIEVRCDRSQKECGMCAIYGSKDDVVSCELSPESPVILEMVAASRTVQHDALCRGLGVPTSCNAVAFNPVSYYNAEDVRISPALEITNRSADRVMQPAICIGSGMELNESYVLTGRMHPHPKSQQSTLLISEYRPTKDALSTYDPGDLSELRCFQPREWTTDSLREKLDHIYEDFEANVTRIFQRRGLHLTVDLTYHSPLLLRFDGRTVKGWVETLVLGDSAQGKSETTLNIMRHYGLGEKVECKNASVAGLLGGLQQMGSKWFVTWGVIPTHDKRLVVLEELKGTSTEVIAKLTDMRSSGVAEIPKIEKRRTHARTRLIALSNPRSDMQLSSYNFGVEAVKELIGGLEDVRRFDYVNVISAADIDASSLNVLQRQRPVVPHVYTAELCRKLVLWAWTREASQVRFSEEAQSACLDVATRLSEEFTDVIPIIDRGSSRYKVARLSAALACRTFSEEAGDVLVRACHVEYIAELLRDTYGSAAVGYSDYTAAMRITQELVDPAAIKKQIGETPFPGDFVKQMLHTNKIELQDIQDWCSWDRHEATLMMSLLVRKHALRRDGRHYRKTPEFIRLLKKMSTNGFVGRPDFIPEVEF